MAIFKRNEPQPVRPRERATSSSRAATGEGAISIIGPGMSITGDLTTNGVVRIEGTVHGSIRAEKAVHLGQGGYVEGDVFTADAVIGGSVRGSVVATNRLELQATCVVDGEVSTRAEHLKMEEGARFSGKVVILDPDSASEDVRPTEAVPADAYGWEENHADSSTAGVAAAAEDSGFDE